MGCGYKEVAGTWPNKTGLGQNRKLRSLGSAQAEGKFVLSRTRGPEEKRGSQRRGEADTHATTDMSTRVSERGIQRPKQHNTDTTCMWRSGRLEPGAASEERRPPGGALPSSGHSLAGCPAGA